VDTRAAPTVVTKLAAQHSIEWFETHVVATVPPWHPGAFRRVYPGFLQLAAFISMNPDRHVEAHRRMFNHLIKGDEDSASAHRRFYDEYLAVMDVPANYYLQTVESFFQKHELATGTLQVRGETVVPAAIERTALLTVEGELDDISAPGQTRRSSTRTIGKTVPAWPRLRKPLPLTRRTWSGGAADGLMHRQRESAGS
jgi:poly(3-hydroxybutyrate) depolymerase